MKLMLVKVLPLPVAIWIRARGLLALSEASRLRMAIFCAGHRPSSISGGMACRRARKGAGFLDGMGFVRSRGLKADRRFFQEGGQGFGPVKGKDAAGAGLRVQPLGE